MFWHREIMKKKAKIERRARHIQEMMKEAHLKLSAAIESLRAFHESYVGFELNDLSKFHHNHFIKLIEQLTANNQKLRTEISKKSNRHHSSAHVVGRKSKYEALKIELERLKAEQERELNMIRENNSRELEAEIAKMSTRKNNIRDTLPPDVIDQIAHYKFDDQQVWRVKDVKEQIENSVELLEDAHENPIHQGITLIMPANHHGKELNEFLQEGVELPDPRYSRNWRNGVYGLLENDVHQLTVVREKIAGFLSKITTFLEKHPGLDKRSAKKHDREDEVYAVKYSFENRKEHYGFNDSDFTVKEFRETYLAKVLQVPEVVLSLKHKENPGSFKEIKDSDPLLLHSGKHIYVRRKHHGNN